MTTTTHRPLCTRPGWELEASHGIRGVLIARCSGGGAVELRTAEPAPAPVFTSTSREQR